MSDRTRFEAKHPVPEGVRWSGLFNHYVSLYKDGSIGATPYNALYQGWLSRGEEQAAGDSGESKHPTYGTLDQLLAIIKEDVQQGYEVRIGLMGALSWFASQVDRSNEESRNAGDIESNHTTTK